MRDITEAERQQRAETLAAIERHALTAQQEIDALVRLVNEERERQGIVVARVNEVSAWKQRTRTYRLRVWIFHDLSCVCPDLPGCATQGDDVDDCLRNMEEAFNGIEESYREAGEQIPWIDGGHRPMWCEERHIIVSVMAEVGDSL